MFTFGPASRGGEVDPFAANVVLLCHFDGTNGDTTTTDVLGNAITLSGFDISSAQSKFGGTSLRNSIASDSAGGAAITPASGLQMGGSDFTFECWAWTTITTNNHIFGFNVFSAGANDTIRVGTFGSTMTAVCGTDFTGIATAFPTSQWNHVALTRAGNTARLWLNGAQIGTRDVTGLVLPTQDRMTIGREVRSGSTPLAWRGHIDEFRITKGIARYTSSFTPPAAPFPNP